MSGFFLVRRDALDIGRLRPHGFKILLEILVRTPRPARGGGPLRVRQAPRRREQGDAREAFRYLPQLGRLRFSEGPRSVAVRPRGSERAGREHGAAGLLHRGAGLHYLVSARSWRRRARRCGTSCSPSCGSSRGHGSTSVGWRARDVLPRQQRDAARPRAAARGAGDGAVDELPGRRTSSRCSLALLRYGLADLWIWGKGKAARRTTCTATTSTGSSRRVGRAAAGARAVPRRSRSATGPRSASASARLSRAQSELVAALAFFARHTRYDEKLGRLGFGIEIGIGRSVEVVASPLLRARRTCSTRTSSSRSCAGRSSRRATRSCTRRASRSTAARS